MEGDGYKYEYDQRGRVDLLIINFYNVAVFRDMAGSAGCFIKQFKKIFGACHVNGMLVARQMRKGDTMRIRRAFSVCAGLALSVLLVASSAYSLCGSFRFIDRSAGLKDYDLNRVAVDHHNPRNVFVSSSSVVYASYDGGRTWKEALSFRASGKSVNTLNVSVNDSSTVWCGSDDGLYTSRDSGKHWKRIFAGMGSAENSVLSAVDIPQMKGSVFIGTRAGLFQSADNGLHWNRIGTLPSDIAVYELVYNRETLYAVTERGLYKGINNGTEWKSIYETKTYREEGEESDDNGNEPDERELNGDMEIRSIAVDPVNPEKLYIGTSMGVILSPDGGRTWKIARGDGTVSRDVRHLAVVPDNPGLMYAATGEGVICYSQQTGKRINIHRGLLSPDIRYLAVYQDFKSGEHVLWAATGNGVYRSAGDPYLPNETHLHPDAVLAMFSHEPTIEEIREAAIRYAEVQPEKIEKWRRAASLRAWLPDLRFSYDKNKDWQSSTYFYSTTTQKYKDDDITNGKDRAWSVSLTWELGDIVWNDAQTSIDTRSRLMVQLRDDVLSEVTRLYYERRRLQIEMAMYKEEDITRKIENELRLQELTANIDALTGSYLSRRLGQGA